MAARHIHKYPSESDFIIITRVLILGFHCAHLLSSDQLAGSYSILYSTIHSVLCTHPLLC